MEKPTISIAVIAKNEADRIGRLLKSASFADEVVVVDSGSTDGTQVLCERLGARVIFNEWPGYAEQKNFAMEQTTSEWVLNLDADEEIAGTLAVEIMDAVLHTAPEVSGFSMPRLSRYLGRWIKYGGWYPDYKVRLVRRGSGSWSGDALHEKLLIDGKVERLSQPILHHVYRGIADQIKTINRFSDIYAAQKPPAGSGFVLVGVGHALGKFLECYVWKLGVLDGIPGLIIAMNSAWYVFLKHAKAWETGLREKDDV
ncbi:MAG: glycosyltransferase family 2 protein [Candidatus Desulfatibia sp.]|uniref:glycosyltransferase family 2 protein n=1 Tax=Candidatus Desulfatibia sp. TaxID=3101189 RepID=UPI002F2C7E13